LFDEKDRKVEKTHDTVFLRYSLLSADITKSSKTFYHGIADIMLLKSIKLKNIYMIKCSQMKKRHKSTNNTISWENLKNISACLEESF
jgi:hypothetical protein